MNISAKFGSNLFCGFRKKDENVKLKIDAECISSGRPPLLSLDDEAKIFVFGADRKSNMAASAHNVF
jgi:hypothetical protein